MLTFRLLILAWLVVIFSSPVIAKQPQTTEFLSEPEHTYWFNINNLPTIELSFTQSNWNRLLQSNFVFAHEVPVTFNYKHAAGTDTVLNVGVKVSGNTSFQLPQESNGEFRQAHFSLDFDEFVEDQMLGGISALRLKRFHNDPSFVRELLYNQIMHNFGVYTAHSSSYVRLEITIGSQATRYWGLYRMNESVNRKEYIDKRFGKDNDDGHLWQANYKDFGIAHFSRIYENWGGISESDRASFEYKGKSERLSIAEQQLVEMAENFTNLEGQEFVDYVNRHINMSLFLKVIAGEAILGHWDGFWGNGNNYQFYIDEQQVLHLIPYDTDNTLGTSQILGDVGERDPMEFGNSRNSPMLINKILAVSEFREEYQGYLKQLVTQYDLMTETYCTSWIESAYQLISGHLQNVTVDNERLADEPANWSNVSSYRLFDLGSGKNWYETRLDATAKSLAEQLVAETEPSAEPEPEPAPSAPNISSDSSGGSFDAWWLLLLMFFKRCFHLSTTNEDEFGRANV